MWRQQGMLPIAHCKQDGRAHHAEAKFSVYGSCPPIAEQQAAEYSLATTTIAACTAAHQTTIHLQSVILLPETAAHGWT